MQLRVLKGTAYMALKKANVALTQTITCLETYNVGRVLALKKASIVLKKTTYVALEKSNCWPWKRQPLVLKKTTLRKATAGLEKGNYWSWKRQLSCSAEGAGKCPPWVTKNPHPMMQLKLPRGCQKTLAGKGRKWHIETSKATSKQTNKQPNSQTNKQRKQTKKPNKQTNKQTNEHARKPANKQKNSNIHTYKSINT